MANITFSDLLRHAFNNTDAYALGQGALSHPELERVESAFIAREKAQFFPILFGLQPTLIHYFQEGTVPGLELIDALETWSQRANGGKSMFNRDAWKKVKKLGYYPIRVHALPEGSMVRPGTPLYTIESTEQWFAPQVSFLDNVFIQTWQPITQASRTFVLRQMLEPIFKKYGVEYLLPYAMNDFSVRGEWGNWASLLDGMAHLLFFDGTDNVNAGLGAQMAYGPEHVGATAIASAHFVALQFGPGEGEKVYLNRILDVADDLEIPIAANVIDTYGSRRYMTEVVGDPGIKEKIIKRSERGFRTVFRPDSGDGRSELKMILDALGFHFGVREHCGLRMVNVNAGALLGDSVFWNTAGHIYIDLVDANWSPGNFVLGSGKGLIYGKDRDTLDIAIKAVNCTIGGKYTTVRKETPGKRGLSGNLKTVWNAATGMYDTYESVSTDPALFASLVDGKRLVLENGRLFNQQSWGQVKSQIALTSAAFRDEIDLKFLKGDIKYESFF